MPVHPSIPSALRGLAGAAVLVAAISAAAVARDNPQAAAPDRGERFCIPLNQIRETRVIDNRTILVTKVGRKEFWKITLVNRCPGLKMSGGFVHESAINQLCKTDPLRVIDQPVGATCMIDAIAPITQAEAEGLRGEASKAAAAKP